MDEKVLNEWIRKSVHKNDVKAEDKGNSNISLFIPINTKVFACASSLPFITKSEGSRFLDKLQKKPTGESAEEYIAKSNDRNLFEKLREKQPSESTEEKDLKAAIKENNFNEDVEFKMEAKVFKVGIRKESKRGRR